MEPGQVQMQECYGGRFSIIVDNIDSLSKEQVGGLDALSEKFGAGKVKMIPSIEGMPPKYEMEGPIADLKPDITRQHAENAKQTVEPIRAAVREMNKNAGAPRPIL